MARDEERESAERGRHADKPTQIPRRGWRDIALRTWRESSDDNVSLISAGVAFYAFLALVPLLGAVVLTYALVSNPATVVQHMRTLFVLLPQDAAHLVTEQMTAITRQSAGKTGLGLLLSLALSLYGAMKGAGAIVTALNIAYEEDESRSFLHKSLISFAITIGAVLMAIVACAAIAALSFLETLIPGLPKPLLSVLRIGAWGAAALLAMSAVACLYRFGPNRDDAKWRWLTPGAAVATVGWLAVSLGFGVYTSNFANYNATYGALGAVVVLLMWLYLSAYVLLLGAELNSEIEHQTAADTTQGHPLPMGERNAEVADTLGDVPESPFSWRKKDEGGTSGAPARSAPASH